MYYFEHTRHCYKARDMNMLANFVDKVIVPGLLHQHQMFDVYILESSHWCIEQGSSTFFFFTRKMYGTRKMFTATCFYKHSSGNITDFVFTLP